VKGTKEREDGGARFFPVSLLVSVPGKNTCPAVQIH